MSEHYEKHAEDVSKAFMDLLDQNVRTQISDEHRNELAMLVEAAISTAVFEQLERAADDVSGVAARLRQRAEYYDKE